MSIILKTYAIDLRGKFVCQCCLEKRWHETIIDVEVSGTRIAYELMKIVPQNKKELGPSINSADNKVGEEEVDFHMQICTVLGDDAWAHVE